MTKINPLLQRYIFHPATVLITAVIATGIFALVAYFVFDGAHHPYLLSYTTPIGIPFICFLFDRAQRYKAVSPVLWAVDAAVIAFALARACLPSAIPWVSGHALFLSYALLTTLSPVARITASLIMLQVAFMKIFVWNDLTILSGVIIGCLAALAYRQVNRIKCI